MKTLFAFFPVFFLNGCVTAPHFEAHSKVLDDNYVEGSIHDVKLTLEISDADIGKPMRVVLSEQITRNDLSIKADSENALNVRCEEKDLYESSSEPVLVTRGLVQAGGVEIYPTAPQYISSTKTSKGWNCVVSFYAPNPVWQAQIKVADDYLRENTIAMTRSMIHLFMTDNNGLFRIQNSEM